jgi:nitrogen fixation NifU-like protein
MMGDALAGQTIEAASELADSFKGMMSASDSTEADSLGDLAALRHLKKYPVRVKCALLPWNTLLEALRAYESSRAALTP